MNVDGKAYRTVWSDNETTSFSVKIIDQKKLPFAFEVKELLSVSDIVRSITDMHVRGAGCIGPLRPHTSSTLTAFGRTATTGSHCSGNRE